MLWEASHAGLAAPEGAGRARRPVVPRHCSAHAHMYHLLLAPELARHRFIARLAPDGVDAVSHDVPLHGSPAGLRLGRCHGRLGNTDDLRAHRAAAMWLGLEAQQPRVIAAARCGRDIAHGCCQ